MFARGGSSRAGCRGEQGPAAASDAAPRAALGGQNVKGKGRVTSCQPRPPPVALLLQQAASYRIIHQYRTCPSCWLQSRGLPAACHTCITTQTTDTPCPLLPCCPLGERACLAHIISPFPPFSLLLPSLTDIQSLHRQPGTTHLPKPPTRTTSVHTRINLHFGVAASGYLAATRHDIHCVRILGPA